MDLQERERRQRSAIGWELFGDMFKARVLELNASDDRGIEVVRTKIKTFAQLASSTRIPRPPSHDIPDDPHFYNYYQGRFNDHPILPHLQLRQQVSSITNFRI